MRAHRLLFLLPFIIGLAGTAHAKKTIFTDTQLVLPTIQPIDPLPTSTPAAPDPTPLPTAVPTPVPTAVPTPLPTAIPTPTPTPPVVVITPSATPLPMLSLPPEAVIKGTINISPRSDVAILTPVTVQQVQRAAQSITDPTGDKERILMNIPSHIVSSTFNEPSTNYSYGTFSGLNRSVTLGLDSLAAVLAITGIYVAVRSGSTMDV